MKHITIAILLLTMTAGLSGCASMGESVISFEMGIRNHVLAQKAWGHWSWCYDDLDHPTDFACGFKTGYRNILEGGNGCQPTLPPQHYWKPKYQTPHGQCRVYAWFDGYSHGALAAKQDGYGDLGQIPISPTARANMESSRRRQIPQDTYYSDGYVDGSIPMNGMPVPNTPAEGTPIELTPPSLPTDGSGSVLNPVETDETPIAPVPLRPYE